MLEAVVGWWTWVVSLTDVRSAVRVLTDLLGRFPWARPPAAAPAAVQSAEAERSLLAATPTPAAAASARRSPAWTAAAVVPMDL